ncbi:prepilin-type N-terminal cleavage/methylation domain-containing protein [Beggiatoa leptomitoformis]|uniref:Prepilin-type N-terminal cleavage/methylation domain-containing protein n=1 Tax=Beggiatoa leptomitoformis TaxID=288004 RepID=A0A2N9YH19_9GAMM|nr:prepilin-type N-terminal cleavage/methylation domain-containing protein [Beggiatoa leptomitoformis]ALG67931.2 prepilin-type N-terminal cleavage/methylation domain-containing protein [Beggiatoa leptomitoformis]AUI69797.1 prepilin-type N-terminal cleavage/methylation domain-containing protein [Beggiatoa leptomitoformis]
MMAHSAPIQYSGFTLLELLVVLLLIGLLAGMTLPRLTNLYNTFQSASEREDILIQLNGLSYKAYQQGRIFVLTTFPASSPEKPIDIPLVLPQGWRVTAEKPILFRENGACNGGIVSLSYQENLSYRAELTPPFCRAHLL